MIKKLFLTAALLLAPYLASAANLVQNPGFDTGKLPPWITYTPAATISGSNIHSGNYAAKFGKSAGIFQTLSSLAPNTTYTLSCWGKVLTPGTLGDGSWCGVKNYGNPEKAVALPYSSYGQRSVTFTTGSASTSALIYGWSDTDASVYVDDFSVSAVPINGNGACGSANGVAVSMPPTTGLCSMGTASQVTGAGPWGWTCSGSNGGSTASCNAPVMVSSAPSGAVAAGFTTLALNSDWTSPMPKNWLGECPNGPDGSWPNNFYADDTGHTWWLNLWWSYDYQHCIVSQVQDPDYGGLVLDMPWTVDTAAAAVGTEIETASADYNGQGQGTANSFPPGMYLEMVARNTPYTVPGNYFAFYTWGVGGIYDQAYSSTEWDVAEVDSNRLWLDDANVHNWSAGSGISAWILQPWNNLAPGTNIDFAKYNTYALRITNDGNTEVGCLYINNIFQACQSLPQGMTASEKTPAGRLMILVANACDYWNQTTTPACADGTLTHLYIKSVRVWSCASWQTTLCTGPLLTAAP
jgi:hypothetical protein